MGETGGRYRGRARTTMEKLVQHLEIGDDCWIWDGSKVDGYGRMNVKCEDGKWRGKLTHILVYEHFVGAVPEGFEIDHKCRNRACCNPSHLEPVTHKVNVRRGLSMVKLEFCKSGRHRLTEENRRPRDGSCKTCDQQRTATRYRAKHPEVKRVRKSKDFTSRQ